MQIQENELLPKLDVWFKYTEADTGCVLSKKASLEILQDSQQNTCARAFF